MLYGAKVFMQIAVVLTVGFDSSLMRTRSLVLQSAGYIVESASSLKEAVARFRAGDFDLVLLCHSIPMKDRDHLTCLIRATGSLTPVISIARNLGACDAFVNATLEDGPNKFLACIGEELGKAARRSANGTAH
jgi:CheY-like chemotaxis protein